jgi:hypothetical protein
MRELLEHPKVMATTTQNESLNVNVEKSRECACKLNCIRGNIVNMHEYNLRRSKMDNQQPSEVEGKTICRVCGEEKSMDNFLLYKNRDKVYRSKRCVSCTKKYHSKYFADDKERFNANARDQRLKNPSVVRARENEWAKKTRINARTKVYEAYGNKCSCCGETEPLFLTLDHVNNDGHIERKAFSQGNLYGRVIREGFPNRFQLLCWNCNQGKRRNNGVCPHQEGSTAIPEGSSPKRGEALISVKKTDEDMVYSLVKAKAAC